MPKPHKRRDARPAIPNEVVHDLRNCLGVAVGTADVVLLDVISDQAQAARDVEKIREACLRAIGILDRWDRPIKPNRSSRFSRADSVKSASSLVPRQLK